MQKKKTLEERLAACGSGGNRYPEAFWLDTCCSFPGMCGKCSHMRR